MRRRSLTLLLALPAVAALGACASTTAGSGVVATGTAGGATTTAASLHAALVRSSRSVTSAAFTTEISAAGHTVTGHGVERLSHGRLTGLRTSESLPNGLGRLSMVYADGKFFVKLPTAQRTGSKPWAEASPTSRNPELRVIYSTVHQLLSTASLAQAGQFAAAASSVRKQGTATVQGMRATRYDVTVDVAKLPESFPGIAALRQQGVTTVPVVIDLDGQGRPVELSERLAVVGRTVSSTTTIGQYNAPVKISAPPADQVAH